MTLNGTRNFELITQYVAILLQNNLSPGFPVTIYKEYYPTMDENNVPALNILLKSVDETRRDSNTTVNECVVAIIGYAKCNEQGALNSLKSKTDLLKLMGQINNIFSKRSSYEIVPNNVIQNIRLSGLIFSNPADFNANQMIISQQELNITLTETNDDVFSNFLTTTNTTINEDINVIYI